MWNIQDSLQPTAKARGKKKRRRNGPVREKLHYLMRIDYWIGYKLPWKAGRAGYAQRIRRNNFTKFIYPVNLYFMLRCVHCHHEQWRRRWRGWMLGRLLTVSAVTDTSGVKQRDKNSTVGTSLLVQWLRLWAPDAGDPDSVPGQESRSHMRQLKFLHLQWRSKIRMPRLIQCNQIKNFFFFKRKNERK